MTNELPPRAERRPHRDAHRNLRALSGVGTLVVGALLMTAVAIFDPTRPAEPVQAQTTSGSLFCASGLPCTTSSLYDAPLQDRLEVTGGSADRLVRGSAADAWRSIEFQ